MRKLIGTQTFNGEVLKVAEQRVERIRLIHPAQVRPEFVELPGVRSEEHTSELQSH